MAKRVLVWTGGTHGAEGAIGEALAGLDDVQVQCARDRGAALAAMRTVHGMITSAVVWDAELARELRDARELEWLQLLNAGFDNVEQLGVPEQVTVTTVGDIGAAVVAEHAVALLLALLRGLPVALQAQRLGEWCPMRVAQAARTLRGIPLAVVGYGHIGAAVARLAGAFGARVIAFARTARTGDDGVEVRALARFRESLPALEAIVVCAPLNAATAHLIDATACAALRPGTVLVNVSRGGLVDTDAVTAALQSGTLGGAALDVVAPEPLPRSHPLWSLPNVLITPHTAWAGAQAGQTEQLCALVVENVGRLARGETLRNVAPIRHG